MGAGYAGSPLVLELSAGQVQRVLVEAGATLVVVHGKVRVCFPYAWLAEQMAARELDVADGAMYRFDDGGWVDLLAIQGSGVLILAPERGRRWIRLLRGMGLAELAGRISVDRCPPRVVTPDATAEG